jgi:sialic acid synthase SpsE
MAEPQSHRDTEPETQKGIHFAPSDSDHGPTVCIIAEIGVNHDGDVQKALSLTHAAHQAGADAVKLQFFDPDLLLSEQAVLAEYQKNQGATDIKAMLRELQLELEAVIKVRELARSLGLGFIVTPFSLEHVPLMMEFEVDAIKIASPDVVNLPLLEACCALGLPMLVSTGTADLAEIAQASVMLKRLPMACLLHCVSSYPTPPEEASLGAIHVMAQAYGLPVGYSDHTTDLHAGALAVAAGACVIEKHITYDCHAQGPDHAASMEVPQFVRYVQQIRSAQDMLGKRTKAVSAIEREVRRISRQSVCAAHDLSAGTTLSRADLTLRRPGTGIPAAAFTSVIGRTLANAIKQGNLLNESDLA